MRRITRPRARWLHNLISQSQDRVERSLYVQKILPTSVEVTFSKPIIPPALSLLLFLVAFSVAGCQPSRAGASVEDGGQRRAIQNKGSDTMVNLALAWAEAYQVVDPSVDIAVTGGGSGTGIASLMNGTVDIANASRAMKQEEIEDAQANGIDPIEHVVAIDALAIVVHQDNPVDEITIEQLSDMFTGRITNWKELGGRDAPIVLVSRETNSGTHVYFLEEVVRRGDSNNTDIFAPQTLLMPSSVGITSEVQRNPNAIGYDGLGYVNPEHEKVLAISESEHSSFTLPSVETAASGSYPLSRNLYMYTAGVPTGSVADYLNWILSNEGQSIVAELGFVPLGLNE
ncbi:MAG TPA: phosphate-binding protein [Chloroflexi bacterium]|nr:phosphate-binding protein [Chloroflexota bacterium]